MLFVNQISKSYGVETILDGISFIVNAGERVGSRTGVPVLTGAASLRQISPHAWLVRLL